MQIILVYFAVVCLTVVLGDNEKVLGSICTIEKDGSKGSCEYLQDCKSALEDLTSDILSQKCSYEGSRLIVCCKSVINSTMSDIQELTKVDKLDSSRKGVGDKSKKKCKEYARYAYIEKVPDTLMFNPRPVKVLECPIEKEELISGGKVAKVGEFPHMALVGYDSKNAEETKWECGGTLISEYFVLTAAHCVFHRAYGEAKHVVLGITNRTDIEHKQIIEIVQTFKHPKFSSKYHDIALLKLAEKVNFSPYVRPACLYSLNETPTERAIASGWGFTHDGNDGAGGVLSLELRKVTLDIYDAMKCNKTYKNFITAPDSVLSDGILDDFMVCAGSKIDKEKDACQGDSGGPLQIYHKDTEDIKCMYDVVGVTAFGKGCGLSIDNPGVYTKVAPYINWIEKIVWP